MYGTGTFWVNAQNTMVADVSWFRYITGNSAMEVGIECFHCFNNNIENLELNPKKTVSNY